MSQLFSQKLYCETAYHHISPGFEYNECKSSQSCIFDILLRLKARGIPSGGSFRFTLQLPDHHIFRARVVPTTSMWWTAGSAKPPLPLSSTVFGIHSLFLPTGCQQTPKDSGYLVSRFQQSSQTYHSRKYVHRFPFRILSH